jgi:hypothetical protein
MSESSREAGWLADLVGFLGWSLGKVYDETMMRKENHTFLSALSWTALAAKRCP